MQQFPKNSQLRIRSGIALRQFSRKFAGQTVFAIGVLLGVLLGVEAIVDRMAYRSIQTTMNNPESKTEELRRGEEWLAAYCRAPVFRHFLSKRIILDEPKAQSTFEESTSNRDKAAWKPVEEADNLETKVILARKYLEIFPAGLKHPEARTIVAKAETQQSERRNGEHLTQIGLAVNAVAPTADTALDLLNKLGDKVDGVPFPDVMPQPLLDLQKDLHSRIEEKQRQVIETASRAEWEEFKQTYVALMQTKDVLEAANFLAARTPKDAQLEELTSHFSEHAPELIEQKVQSSLKSKLWQPARESAQLVDDANVSKLLPIEAIKELKKLGSIIDEEEDRNLYAQVIYYKPQCQDQADAYLLLAPLKKMQAEVIRYRKYLDDKKVPLQLTLTLSAIDWHDQYYSRIYSYKNDVVVQAKGANLIAETGISSRPNTQSADVGSGTLTVGLSETITINVSIVARYGLLSTSTTPGGSATWEGTVNQLQSGVTVDLTGKGFTNKVTFSLRGIPPEPPLPAWGSH